MPFATLLRFVESHQVLLVAIVTRIACLRDLTSLCCIEHTTKTNALQARYRELVCVNLLHDTTREQRKSHRVSRRSRHARICPGFSHDALHRDPTKFITCPPPRSSMNPRMCHMSPGALRNEPTKCVTCPPARSPMSQDLWSPLIHECSSNRSHIFRYYTFPQCPAAGTCLASFHQSLGSLHKPLR